MSGLWYGLWIQLTEAFRSLDVEVYQFATTLQLCRRRCADVGVFTIGSISTMGKSGETDIRRRDLTGNRTYPQKYFVGISVGERCGSPSPKYLKARHDFVYLDSASGHHLFKRKSRSYIERPPDRSRVACACCRRVRGSALRLSCRHWDLVPAPPARLAVVDRHAQAPTELCLADGPVAAGRASAVVL